MSAREEFTDESSGEQTLEFDEELEEIYTIAELSVTPAWWEKAYPGGPPVGPSKLIRPLYFPGNSAGKAASSPGDDVLAMKRAVWRGGRWEGPASRFDDVYSKNFARGVGGNVIQTGLAGFQRQMRIQATGYVGDETYQALRYAKIPEGLPNAGQPLFDATAVELLERAANPPASADQARADIADYCRRCIAAEPKWHYRQERPIKTFGVKPETGGYTDCSGHSTCAYYWAGAPDPNGRGFDGYGYTGTLINNPKVVAPYKPGDLAIYGSSTSNTEHVTTCYVGGSDSSSLWCSHGSEAAPYSVKLLYRSDLLVVVRPKVVA